MVYRILMKSLSRGFLIALEGIDGSGKSTLAKTIFDHFRDEQFPVLLTKEPGGSPLGAILRPFLQEQKITICPQSEFLLFAADRAQHFHEIIIPALQKKTMIISDRLADSSLVYQGFGRGLNITMLETVNEWTMEGIKPDITLYLRVNLETALSRLQKRNNSLTSFEQDHTFFQKIITGFDTLYADHANVIIIDGEQSIRDIHAYAVEHINSWIINNKI